jgi:hypothetical protein
VVAEVVVEQAEPVEIEEDHGVGPLPPHGAGLEDVEVLKQPAAVRQACPFVGARLLAQPLVVLLEALILPHQGDCALAPRPQVDVAGSLAAPALSDVHVQVGGTHRSIDVSAEDGDADRDRGADELTAHVDRLRDAVAQLVHQLDGLAHVQARQHDHELVATDAGDDPVHGHPLHDPRYHLDQHRVADVVAVVVVDHLEPVHVEDHHRARPPFRGEPVQALEEPLPVGQPRHRVRRRSQVGREPELLELGDVAEGQHDAAQPGHRPSARQLMSTHRSTPDQVTWHGRR